jgi:hypothetical protein
MNTLLLVVALATVLAGQSDSAALAGLWTAEFDGQTFIRLEFRSVGDNLTGSITLGDIEVDDQGGLRRVAAPRRDPTPIFDVTQRRSTVTFSQKDGHDTDRFEFRVLDDGRGELRFILTDELRKELAAEGVPIPKPIMLTRRRG